ncbi:MAG: ATP-binding protein [Bdellovibrionota bacterium]
MTEQFFQSVEFRNLLDILTLLAVLVAAPFLGSIRERFRSRDFALLAVGLGLSVLSLGIGVYESIYVLLTQFPSAPRFARYLAQFTEALSGWFLAAFFFSRFDVKGARRFATVSGVLVLIAGLGAGIGGWQRSALLRSTFHFRTEAEILFGAIRLFLFFPFWLRLSRRQPERPRAIAWICILLALREVSGALFAADFFAGARTFLSAVANFSRAGALVVMIVGLADFDRAIVRARGFRLLLIGFVLLSTTVMALSFNYLLRLRILEESLGRYRGEARKIGNDIADYLERLDQQVRALASPELYAALAHQPESAESRLPHRYLLRDFRSVGFYTAGGQVLRYYSGEEAAFAPIGILDAEGRSRLWASRTGTLLLARNFISHGSLFYEVDGLLRIRGDRPQEQPELLFAAAVRDALGRESGYIEAVLPTQALQRFFAGYGATTGWDFLATSQGLVLAHGSPEYPGFDLTWFSDAFPSGITKDHWHRFALPGGANYVVLETLSGRDWVVGRALSTQTILGAFRKLRGETLVIVFVTLAITIFAAILLQGFVSRQRLALERATLELQHKGAIEEKNVELSMERRKIETILLSIGEGVIVCDASDRIVFVNPRAEAMLGRAARDLLGEPASTLGILPLEQALRQMKAERESGEQAGGIEQVIAQIGGTDVRGSIAPIVREGENFQGSAIVLQDISELMKVDRIKTEILSTVSHSLRTPLTSIKSFTEILLEKAGRLAVDREREYLQVIDVSTDRLTRLVNNILDLSKIAGGKMQYSFRPASLRELLEESVMAASGAAKAKGVSVRSHWNGLDVKVTIDRPKMMQVFDNLLGNAVKFTPPEGNIDITLGKTAGREIGERYGRKGLDPEADYAFVEVRDTGRGIGAENLERVFERFFQEVSSRDATEGGTGLGLAISREYVLAHHGQIWASSETGNGSSFYVVLPV